MALTGNSYVARSCLDVFIRDVDHRPVVADLHWMDGHLVSPQSGRTLKGREPKSAEDVQKICEQCCATE
eukprot:849007-Karenia_brevis.AAC.1